MPQSRKRRIFGVLLAVCLAVGVGGYLARDAIFFTFLYKGSPADWELMQIHRQAVQGIPIESDASGPERCFEIAVENPGTRAELTAYLMIAHNWPAAQQANESYDRLLQAAEDADVEHWQRALEAVRGGDSSEKWQNLGALLFARVRQNPDHPQAAALLNEVTNMIAPVRSADAASELFVAAADFMVERFVDSPNIANFCEHVGGMGNAPSWGRAFEAHVRKILAANENRTVRSAAHLALASIVRSTGIERQAEAQQLFQEYLDKFDGETAYRAQGIEQFYRRTAERILTTMRLHGLGSPAVATVGRDLDGQPMSLADEKGKVVLLSFWATWCGPCMKAIPEEKQLLEEFDPQRFTIVGVNGDDNAETAQKAVAEFGMQWRSFQLKNDEGNSIAKQWHVNGWPTFYLLDSDGIIAQHWEGRPPTAELRKAISSLMK